LEFREALRLALATLWSNRLRSFLTVLGNVVAVLSVVALVSVIQGLNLFVSRELLSTGSNTFTLAKFGMITSYEEYLKAMERPDLTLEDARDLERKCTLAAAVVPSIDSGLSVKRGRLEAENAPVRGTGAGYPLISRLVLAAGRDLTEIDVDQRAEVAVIGDRIKEKLFAGEDPLGKDIRVGGHRVTVIGVLQRRGGSSLGSDDDQVLLPVTTLLKYQGSRAQSILITVLASDPTRMEAAQDEASLFLKIRHGKKPWDKADFDCLTDEQFYSLYKTATQGIYGLLVGVVSLSLLVGGIVIMNIMLVSVTERTREIGIRKAVGARRRDIVAQFLSESVMLAFAGGVIGVLGGMTAAMLVRALTPLPASIQLWSVLVGLFLASSVGLFFGIYPAWRASRLLPIAALRYET
jgi:putative ABC transport system permease protein